MFSTKPGLTDKLPQPGDYKQLTRVKGYSCQKTQWQSQILAQKKRADRNIPL